MRPMQFLSFVIIFAGLFASGCDSGGELADGFDNRPTTTVRRGNGGEPASLDPALAEDIHSFNVLIDLYEGLVAEAANGEIVPGVADSWEVSEDGLQYRFHLRSDARWSNGETVVASDFVNSFRRVASVDSQSVYGFLLESLRNFDSVNNGQLPVQDLGVSAEDEETLLIQLSAPNNYFLAVLAMPISFPVYGQNPTGSQFSDPAEFVGNGAYTLVENQVSQPIKLRRNDNYWDTQSVNVDEVVYFPISNPQTEFNMYRAGELDITGTVPTGQFESVKTAMPEHLRVSPSLAFYYLAFDLTEPPLDNKLLRQALSMSIDRKLLVDAIGRGEQPAYSVVPPGVRDYKNDGYDWQNWTVDDREREAIELYNAAGYGLNNRLKLKLTYDAGDIHESVALIVSDMWRKVLGAEIELEKKEWMQFLATREERSSWQVMRFSWNGDYNDATTFLDIFRSSSLQNLPQYVSDKYDQFLNDAATSINTQQRSDFLYSAEETVINDYPIAPLYFYVSKHLVSPSISGFEDNILDRHPSKYLSISR